MFRYVEIKASVHACDKTQFCKQAKETKEEQITSKINGQDL